MNKKYRIADYVMEIRAPFEWIAGERFIDFEKENDRDAEFVLNWMIAESIEDTLSEENRIFENQPSRYYLQDGVLTKYERINFGWEPFFCFRTDLKRMDADEPIVLDCCVVDGSINSASALGLFTHMELSFLLNLKRSFILHSACIRQGNGTILFSGPSGVGKSTQAALWEELCGSRLINGDRTALRKQGKDWKAYGLPYAGTSGIYRNESAPVKAVVFLKQTEECRIRRMDSGEAFKRILSETFVYYWISELQDRIMQEMLSFASDVPVYLLECTPDARAVRILAEKMKEDGIYAECEISVSRT